jgi:hypothetical protein
MVVVRFEKRLVWSAFWQAIPSYDQGRKTGIPAETVWTAKGLVCSNAKAARIPKE